MGILDALLQQGGGLAGLLAQNPNLVAAAASLLSSKPGTIGGTGGLAGLIGALQQGGLGDIASSWVGTGPNKAISPEQLQGVLGSDVLGQFARQAGLSGADAGSALAQVLPALVNEVTPQGRVPEAGALEGVLGSLLGGLGR